MQEIVFKQFLKAQRPLTDEQFNQLIQAQIERIEQEYPSGIHLVKN